MKRLVLEGEKRNLDELLEVIHWAHKNKVRIVEYLDLRLSRQFAKTGLGFTLGEKGGVG
jgi:hypothetical protein